MNRFAMRRWLFVLILCAIPAAPLLATSFTSSQSGNWSSTATWGGGGAPGPSDSATVVNGHTITLDVPVSVSSLTLGGTLTGTQSLNVTSTFTWNGGINSGGGTTTIAAAATMNVSSYGTLDGRTLINLGTIAFPNTYYLTLQNGAVLTNSGTVDFQGDGAMYLGSGAASITNSGTIKKSGGTGNSSLYTLPITAQSGSQLLVQSGAILLGAVTGSGATFDVSSGATMYFYSNDTRTFDASSTFSGAGTMQWSSGTNTVSGNYDVTGTTLNTATTSISTITSVGNVTVSGGTLTLNGASTVNIPTLSMQGGTLNGSAPITLTGPAMSWTGGMIAGSGAFTIPSGTTVSINGYLYFDTRAFSNAGAINFTNGYYAYMQNGSALTNNGSGTIDFQGDSGLYLNTGTATISNGGTIKKSAGTNIGGLSVPLLAQSGSQIQVQSGTFYLGAVTSTGATFTVASGATLSAVYNNTRTFDSASSISGAGTVSWGSGTNTVDAVYNVTGATTNTATTTIGTITSAGNVTESGGTLTLNNVAGLGSVTVPGGTLTLNSASTQTIPTLVMGGGTLNGSAPITLTAPAMTWTGGVIAGTGLLTIPSGTTITMAGYHYFDTRPISNAGTINFTSSYYAYMQNGAALTNGGTIDFQGDNVIYINTGTATLTNNGTIKKSGGTGVGGLSVPLIAQSGSQIQAQSGTFYLGAVTSTGATFTVASGATLSGIYNNPRTFDPASSISGAGTVSWGSGTNTVDAVYNVTGGTTNSGTTTIGTITSAGNVSVSGGALTLNNVAGLGSVTATGGTLTLNSASTQTIPTLVMGGGTLNGSAPITLTAPAMTWTGGTIGGTGLLTIPSGTTITMAGYHYFDTRPVSNAGTINFTSSYYAYMQNGAALTNSGTIDFQGDNGLYINTGTATLTNSGTIKKSGGTSIGGLNVPLVAQTGSQVQVQSGTFYLAAVTSTGGAFTVAGGTTLNAVYSNTRTFDSASAISGAGTVTWASGTNTVDAVYNVTGATTSSGGTTTIGTITSVGSVTVSGGTLTLNGAPAVSIPTLTMQGGTLNGSAPINLTATAMTWSGGTIGGSGTLTIPSTTTITIAGYPLLDARPFSNAGTINLTSTFYIYMQNNAVLTNSGTIDIQNDGSVNLNSAVGTTAVVNSGTIKKSGGTGGGSPFTVPLVAQSASQFLVQSGVLYLGAVTSTGATFNVAGGTTLQMYYNETRAFDAASIISGTGTVQWSQGTNTVSGTISTPIGLSGGTLTINSAVAQSIPTLTISAGTLNGSAALNVTGAAMTWTGGTIGGSGAFSIPSTTTITVTGGLFLDTRPLNNAGTMNFTGGSYFYLVSTAVLTNNGTLDFQGDGGLYFYTGTPSIINNGTIKKSGGTFSSAITAALTAASGSQFLVQSGTFNVAAVTSSGATFNVAANKTLAFNTNDTRTFDAASTITGTGTAQWQSGTNTFSGTISAPTGVSGGTLTLNSAATQSIPILTMAGGTLNGSASINLTGPAMTWTGGIISGSGTLSISASTTITISGVPYLDGRPVTNGGTIAFTTTYYMYMQNSAALTNTGTIDFQGDGAIYLNTGTASIVSSGTIRKSGGTVSGSVLNVPLTAQSGSQFLVQSGTIYVGAVTSTGAAFDASNGAVLNFYYGNTRTFDAATTISGAGTVRWQGGTNTVTGTISANIAATGGTLTINSAATQSIPTLTMDGGTLNGSTAINVTGTTMTWTGGTLNGNNTLSIAASATITLNGYVILDTRPITNAGTIRISSTYNLYLQNGAALTNNGTIDLPSDGSIYLNGGVATLTNNGMLTKSGGTGTSYVSVPMTNAAAGTVRPSTGTISFSALTQSGTLAFPIASATTFGKVSVVGAFALGGTLTVSTTGGYVPANGASFPILSYGSFSGAFASKNLDYPTGTFTENYTATTLTVSAGPQALALTGAAPNRGAAAGGTSVNLTGSNFVAGTTVTFGGVAAAFVTFNNSTSLTVVTPAHAAGPVDVVVANPSTQTATLSNGFTFTGLVSYYSFDVANAPGKDVAGSNDAVSTTGVTQVSGKAGSAGSFISGYMDLPATASLNLRSADFTLEAFVNSGSTTNTNWFTKAAVAPVQQYGLGTANGTKALFSFDAGAGGSATSITDVFDSTWHHVAAVKRGNVAEIWVDGRLEVASPITGTSDTGAFAIGRNGACCDSFNGLIDEARIYNYALTASEVRTDALVTDLAITKSAPPSVTMGQNISYGITVTNNGPITATGVTVSDTLPGGTAFISATPSQGTCGGTTTITCALGTMANGASATVTIVVAATTAGSVTNTATVSANQSDPSTSDNSSSATTTVNTLTCSTPAITPAGPTTFCAGGSVQLTAIATSPSGYQWYRNNIIIGGATAATYLATSTGGYTVRVTYPSSCSATSASTNVTVNPAPPTPAITPSGPANLCTGGSVTLAAPPGYTYVWSTSATTQSITVATAGSYTVTVTNANGCSATSAPATVTVTPNPTVTITGPNTACAGSAITLDVGPGFASYLWSTGETTQIINPAPTSTTTYGVTVTNAGNCSGSASKTVTVSANPTPVITAPATVCASSTGNTASTGAVAGATYAWTIAGGTITAGQGTTSITFSAGMSGNVQLGVTVTGSAGCSASASKSAGIAATGSVAVSAPPSVAANMSGNTASVSAGPAGSTYAWTINGGTITAGQGTATITWTAGNLGSVMIGVTVTNSTCSSSGSATVPISNSADLSVNVSGPPSVNTGDPITFIVAVSNAGPNPAQGVTVLDTLPGGATFMSASGSGWTCNGSGNAVSCSAQAVGVGSASPITIVVTAPSTAGMMVNTATVGASTNDPNTTNNHSSAATQVNLQTADPCANRGTSTPIAPADKATVASSLLQFQWSAVDRANGYRVWAAVNGGDFNTLGTTASDTTLTTTIASGHVEWYVQALFQGCAGTESQHVTFTIPQAMTCPSTPATIASPSTGATLTSTSVPFSWTPAPNAIGYEVWLSFNNAAPSLLGATTSTSLTHDVPAGALEWFVRTNVNGCPPLDSAHATFTVSQPPTCPTQRPLLTKPVDNDQIVSPADFQWSAAPQAAQYGVWIARDHGTPTLLAMTGELHLDAQPLQPGSYDWYVEAQFSHGCPSAQSAGGNFTVVQPPPMCAPPVAPAPRADRQVSSNVQYTIAWNRIGNAASYEYEEAGTSDFAGASLTTTTSDHVNFTHTNPSLTPITFFFRVRMVSQCDSARSLFSPAVVVAILPTQTANTSQVNGATPADAPQIVSYTLTLGGNAPGSIPAQPGQTFSVLPNQPWISVTPPGGTVTADGVTITVTANTVGLPLGTSTGAITILFGASSGRLGVNSSTSATTTVSVNLVQPVTSTSKNAPPPDALIIPAVAHADGINSTFQSDIRVTNTAPQVQKYQITFTPTGDAGSKAGQQASVSIDPGATLALDDILSTWFGAGASAQGAIGMLEIRPLTTTSSSAASTLAANSGIPSINTFASSRTYNMTATGTLGQFIPAIPFSQFIGALNSSGLASVLTLQQIAQSDAFRTNVGLVEGSGNPATVLLSVFGDNGSKLAEISQALTGGQHLQLNSLLASHNLAVNDGRIEVRVTSAGGKVTAYASVVDNATNDPLLVSPVQVSSLGATKWVVPGVADLNNGIANWRSDVRIYNSGSTVVNATLTYIAQDGGTPQTSTLSIAPNEVKQLDGILQSLFGITNSGGALHVDTSTSAPLVVTARTYNQTSNGTYGQFIPAVTPNDAAGKGQRALQILQVEESDRYRSNIGIAEVAGKPATIEITAVPGDAKFSVKAQTTLTANEFRQYGSLLRSLGLPDTYNARVTVRVIDGDGKVTAYASVVDQRTQVPTFVPAQ